MVKGILLGDSRLKESRTHNQTSQGRNQMKIKEINKHI